ncbi:MAG: hypothetical protein ABSA11_12550 [Candidatus Bathyarchaeia archaeon]|jgi:hypothetical protein
MIKIPAASDQKGGKLGGDPNPLSILILQHDPNYLLAVAEMMHPGRVKIIYAKIYSVMYDRRAR